MYGRCDPCSEREPGTGRLRREQAPVPCTPAMADDHTLSKELATTQRAGPHEDPLTASSQSSHVLYGTSEGFILLVPTRFTEIHISSPVLSMSLRAKDHLENTKVAVFPRNCAEEKVQTGSAAAGGHRRVATRKTTGDLTTRRGAGDPVRRAEVMTVPRYGHLQSALVVVDACVRTEWEPPTLRAAPVCLHAPFAAPPRCILPLQRRALASVLQRSMCGCEAS